MRLTEIEYTHAVPVDGYGPGFFRIGGEVFEGAILTGPQGIEVWGGFDDTAPLLKLGKQVDVVLVGTGAELSRPPADFRQALEDAGIGVEPMASPTACRSYNMLLSEGRRVALALLPV